MDIRTGETIYETVLSLDQDGNPISGATFDSSFYINGTSSTAVTLSLGSIDATTGIFSVSFSSSTYGYHQFRLLNNTTDVVYVSQTYVVKSDNELAGGATVYVGL